MRLKSKFNGPEPEVKFAWLPSAGYDYMIATKHEFSHTEGITVMIERADGTSVPKQCTAFVFRCRETGAMRRWGYERPPTLREHFRAVGN